MRKVCRLTREVLDIAAREAKPGVTTDHIDKVLHEACLARDVRILQKSTSTVSRLTRVPGIPLPT